jgi:hypothetical protein
MRNNNPNENRFMERRIQYSQGDQGDQGEGFWKEVLPDLLDLHVSSKN